MPAFHRALAASSRSAFTTGGSFESAGYGYGPGIGPGYDKLVLIVSRASGAPLVANALQFAGELVKGKVFDVAAKEFAAAEKAGLNNSLLLHKTEECTQTPSYTPSRRRRSALSLPM